MIRFLLPFIFLLFIQFTKEKLIFIIIYSTPDYSNPNQMIFSNINDFFNGLNNKSLPSDFYEIYVNTSVLVNGDNFALSFRFFLISIYF